jgi:DNA-binding transcriptional ArsR family regulator
MNIRMKRKNMNDIPTPSNHETIPILPDSVPIVMPELPPRRILTTMQEFKAVSDETRSRILGLIQQQPASARQVADRLGSTSGAIGHHLHLLEAAGLVQVVARRFIRGTVANYYARTARMFVFDFPRAIKGDDAIDSISLRKVNHLHDEMLHARASGKEDPYLQSASLHLRLTPERAHIYHQRLRSLIDEMILEAPESTGQVYSIFITMFTSPDYLQVEQPVRDAETQLDDGGDPCNQ